MSETFFKYFPSLSDIQKEKLAGLKPLYKEWNTKVNVISRKDMENFDVHHLLHSLAIAKVVTFMPGTRILDAGTGGGFPGIPLSIIFPDSEFTLLDSITKKIKVVESVAGSLGLENVSTIVNRVEDEKRKFDFIISRALMGFPGFVKLVSKNIHQGRKSNLGNGIICLKGGDLNEELKPFKNKVIIWDIKEFFTEPFFETKKVVYLAF
jgi:16S rRNA (guanine527-N7)-methyltransferase